jgi:glycosyltransferase involved in cell wall biosynthesis
MSAPGSGISDADGTPGAATTSVVIALYNGAAFIAEAIESVRSQTRPVDEIIVVDDGSGDAGPDIVAAMDDVTLLRQPNAGPSAARNAGLAQATGDYIAVLDADDLWPPGRQAVLAAVLDDEPDIGIVMGRQRLRVMPGATLPAWVPDHPDPPSADPTSADPTSADRASADRTGGDPEALDPTALPRPTGSVLARRSVYEAVGDYAEDLRHGEDSDWFLRARDRGVGVALLDDVILVRRLHGANLTNDTAGQRQAMFEVLARRMARRRAASGAETGSGT